MRYKSLVIFIILRFQTSIISNAFSAIAMKKHTFYVILTYLDICKSMLLLEVIHFYKHKRQYGEKKSPPECIAALRAASEVIAKKCKILGLPPVKTQKISDFTQK